MASRTIKIETISGMARRLKSNVLVASRGQGLADRLAGSLSSLHSTGRDERCARNGC